MHKKKTIKNNKKNYLLRNEMHLNKTKNKIVNKEIYINI